MRLAGQVAIVTGGALGIGGGISRRLAAAGAHVVVADINADAAAAARDETVAAGGRCTIVVGDIRDRYVVAKVTETALAIDASRIDVLVNNVGDFRPAARDFLHSTEEQWQTLYELNLLHVLRMCHAVLPAMVKRGRGAIVNNATVEAFRGIPYAAPYAAFNAGVVAFTRSLAVDVAQHGIRVNAIAPDLADTPQTPAELMLRAATPT
jgi:2-hydroxycyclohexanecarboxyl-CoA dehydrogenase